MHVCKLLILFLFIYLTSLSPDCSIEGGSKRLLRYLCFSLATSDVDISFTSSHEHVLLITFYSLNTSSHSL